MRYWGVHYDTGVHFSQKFFSRGSFDQDLVRYEIRAIKQDLHANAVRIVGEDIERLKFAAQTAIENGLSVFFSPWFIDREPSEVGFLLTRAAEIAEGLRAQGGDIVFIAGCEVSLFSPGILPGSNVYDRVDWVLSQKNPAAVFSPQALGKRVNAALSPWVKAVRASFRGPVTYAGGPWEGVDWSQFDMVGLDHYRQGESRKEYAAALRSAAYQGKKVAVTEFGCCSYKGADKLGGLGWTAIDGLADAKPAWAEGKVPERNEETQARYITEQLDIMVDEGVEAALIFTFANSYLIHDPDEPSRDFDMAGYGLVKRFDPQTPRGRELPPWGRKRAFQAVADYFARLERSAKQHL
jgi:hypothetical protein